MLYTEAYYKKKLCKAMTELGLPEFDKDWEPPEKISFLVRVDILVNHCQNLQAKIAGEETDKERLDWLEHNWCHKIERKGKNTLIVGGVEMTAEVSVREEE